MLVEAKNILIDFVLNNTELFFLINDIELENGWLWLKWYCDKVISDYYI